jgi:Ca-activated chloride channel homolog
MMRRFVRSQNRCRPSARRGASIVLLAVTIVVLVAMTMFAVDVAFIQLTRTELRAASDAAVKAGVEAMGRNQDADAGIKAAIEIAAMNSVAGRPLQLAPGDIEIGSSEKQKDGSWTFLEGKEPFTAMRVNARMSDDNANGAVNLFFAGVLGQGTYEPSRTSTAANFDQDFCLVIDRSHSMTYDMSGVNGKFPPTMKTSPSSLLYPPVPKLSRWAALADALGEFLDIAQKSKPKPRIALVTWASEIDENSSEYKTTKTLSPAVLREQPFSSDYAGIRSSIAGHFKSLMMGRTNMAAGIDEGVAVLTSKGARPFARKTMILMTDGLWNQGRSPVLAAQDAAAKGITIHVVTFLKDADQPDMREVADLTGGTHYHARTAAELREAFRELARTLPVVLTE